MNICIDRLTELLIKNNAIESSDKELYGYAFYSIWITISPLVLVLILCLWTGHLPEGVVMILPFMCIRKYSGGYHAKKGIICFISSCTLLLACLYVVATVKYEEWISILMLLCVCSLTIFSPIDSINRTLDSIEKRACKKKAFLISAVFTGLHILLLHMNLENLAVSISVGLIISAVLQLPCICRSFKKAT